MNKETITEHIQEKEILHNTQFTKKNKDGSRIKVEKQKKRNKSTLKLGIWNVRSIRGKEIEIIEEMEKQQLDFLGITETKKKGKGINRIAKGYWLYWSGVNESERGKEGVGMIIKPEKIESVVKENFINERILTAEIRINATNTWTILVAYGPNENAGKEEKDQFWEILQKEIDSQRNNIIIMGDLNGRVGNNNKGIERYLGRYGERTKNSNGERILELCRENDLVVANSKFQHKDIHIYTREIPSRQEKSIIDYFLVSRACMRLIKDVIVKREPEIGSDHYLVRTDIMIEREMQQEKRRRIVKENIRSYRLKEESIRKEYQKTLEIKLARDTRISNIEEEWKYLKEGILEAAKESCGTIKICNKDVKKTAWWTAEIKQKVSEKKNTWKKYIQTKNESNYELYKNKRKEVKQMIKNAKQEEWVKFGNKLREDFTGNQKLFYSTLKQLRQKKSFILKNIKDKQGNLLTNEEEIMERWKEYFKEMLEHNKEQEKEKDQERSSTSEQNLDIINEEPSSKDISRDELEEAIKTLRLGKAPGKDTISPEMIKYMGEVGKEKLLQLMNNILKAKRVPKDWKSGIIVPLYKKGDRRECSNYRGITLLSTPGKIWTRIWYTRIRQKLENTLEEGQCGFRKGRGVQDNIFILRQISEKAINKGKEIHLCFIDLEKAFDRVRRDDIWATLEKRNLEKTEIEMIKALYDKTTNLVRSRNEESMDFESRIGLRQGCVLSPLLFALVIDEAIKKATMKTRKYKVGRWKMKEIQLSELLYADDMVLVAHSEEDLQYNVEIYHNELRKVNMKINIGKTKTMVIAAEEIRHSITIEGQEIEQVDTFKYLGAYISSNGNLEEEINERTAAVGRTFNAIKTTFLGKSEIPTKVKTEVVKKVVFPALVYSSESWVLSNKQKSKLRSMEMRFLRKIEGKTRRDRIRNITYREILDTKPIETIIQEKQLGWLGHMLRMGEDRSIRQIYEARPGEKNRVGRPRRTWTEEVKTAAQKRGLEWSTVKRIAQNRKQWKEWCRKIPAVNI